MKRCSIDAFARCPLNERCGDFRDAAFMEGSECDAFNQAVLNRPRTNADHIRNMSDGDLASYLDDIAGDDFSRNYCDGHHCTGAADECSQCLLRYLQSPVKGGTEYGLSLSSI